MCQQMTTSECENCGIQFSYPTPKRGRRVRRWCSLSCRTTYIKNAKGQQIRGRHVLVCVVCSATFTATHKTHKTCSKECRMVAARLNAKKHRMFATKPCKCCGVVFAGDPDRAFCSKACRREHGEQRRLRRRQAAINRKVQQPLCSECGKPSRSKGGVCFACRKEKSVWRRTHCIRCSLPHGEPPALSPRYCPVCKEIANREQRKKDRYNRRQRKRCLQKAGLHEPIDRVLVFNRDGWRCRHCRRKCVPGAPSNRNIQATIDHIIPLSRGGTHTYENVQLLCRACNEKKQATIHRQEQLWLIG